MLALVLAAAAIRVGDGSSSSSTAASTAPAASVGSTDAVRLQQQLDAQTLVVQALNRSLGDALRMLNVSLASSTASTSSLIDGNARLQQHAT